MATFPSRCDYGNRLLWSDVKASRQKVEFCMFLAAFAYCSILKVAATRSPEMSVHLLLYAQPHIPEGNSSKLQISFRDVEHP
jgi:hypothetical protein